jgi:hypothetical protein
MPQLAPGLEKGDFDPIDRYRKLEEMFGKDAADKWYKSYEKSTGQDRGYIDDQFKDKGYTDFLSSPKPEPTPTPVPPQIIVDPTGGKFVSVTSSPGSERLAETNRQLLKGGQDLPPAGQDISLPPMRGLPDYNVQPDQGNYDQNIMPSSQQDVDRSKDEHEPNSPLKKKTSFDDDGFKKYLSDYQDKASEIRLIGRLGEAAHNLGTLNKTKPQDASYFREIVSSADQPMKDAMNAAKLNDQLTESKAKRGLMADASDPNSEVSKNYRDTWRAVAPDIFKDKAGKDLIPNFDSLSALELKSYVEDPLKAQFLALSKDQMAQLTLGAHLGDIAGKSLEGDAQRTATASRDDKLHQYKMDEIKAQNAGKIDAIKAKPAPGEKPARPLPAGAAGDLGKFDATTKYIDDILKFKEQNKYETGPMLWGQSYTTKIKDQPNLKVFSDMVGRNLVSYIQSLSGKVVSDRERAMLQGMIPSLADKNESFTASMRELQRQIKNLRQAELDSYANTGYNVGKFPNTQSELPAKSNSNIVTLRKGNDSVSFDLSKPQDKKDMEEAKNEGFK